MQNESRWWNPGNYVRTSSKPEPYHNEIYRKLNIKILLKPLHHVCYRGCSDKFFQINPLISVVADRIDRE
ncbi:UNVERIFIED_CONTAM: hypothetical protein Cloal_2212 [Acetivibrio alkalicellulosi]